jgi:Cu+-exporting ATPase
VRDAETLEAMGRIDCVLLDKTGTLTTGSPTVKSVVAVSPAAVLGGTAPLGQDDLLRLAASASQLSQHPLAKAIVERAGEMGFPLETIAEFHNMPGLGVEARVAGKSVCVGSRAFMRSKGIDFAPMEKELESATSAGLTVVVVGVDQS